jgi:hypothetical protein
MVALAALAVKTTYALYAGGGLTILTRNDLDGMELHVPQTPDDQERVVTQQD